MPPRRKYPATKKQRPTPEGYLTFGQAAAEVGTTLPTLRRSVATAGIKVYRDKLDWRRKLLKAADVEKLKTGGPVPVK